ncbi:MAG: thioredoxin family protein [Actinomycetota bacterium]|nr:thioredoxin family protein [Actinomycetota bacterium]
MKVQILGTGCPKCKQTELNAMEALTNLGIQAEVEKVTDINQIVDFGVLATPALAIDGEVVFSGRTPSVQEIEGVLVK